MQARVIGHPADVRFAKPHVRFTRNSGHLQRTSPRPLCANSGHGIGRGSQCFRQPRSNQPNQGGSMP